MATAGWEIEPVVNAATWKSPPMVSPSDSNRWPRSSLPTIGAVWCQTTTNPLSLRATRGSVSGSSVSGPTACSAGVIGVPVLSKSRRAIPWVSLSRAALPDDDEVTRAVGGDLRKALVPEGVGIRLELVADRGPERVETPAEDPSTRAVLAEALPDGDEPARSVRSQRGLELVLRRVGVQREERADAGRLGEGRRRRERVSRARAGTGNASWPPRRLGLRVRRATDRTSSRETPPSAGGWSGSPGSTGAD